jgi:hypothetical protein
LWLSFFFPFGMVPPPMFIWAGGVIAEVLAIVSPCCTKSPNEGAVARTMFFGLFGWLSGQLLIPVWSFGTFPEVSVLYLLIDPSRRYHSSLMSSTSSTWVVPSLNVTFSWYPTPSVQYTVPRTLPRRLFVGRLVTGVSWLVISR